MEIDSLSRVFWAKITSINSNQKDAQDGVHIQKLKTDPDTAEWQ